MKNGLATVLLLWGVCLTEGLTAPTNSQAQAQSVIPDGSTIGTETEGIEGSFLTIYGGTIDGDNLFHSFDTFSPDRLTSTFFRLEHPSYNGAADGVTDVFARVTGSSNSYLNGYLGVLGGNNPNLFILNPNGILLGSGAYIDVPGSLFLSTGESVLFEDGYRFSVADTTTDSLLTISAPIGIQFGPEASLIQAAEFEIDENNTTNGITLLGGDIIVDSASLEFFGDHIQLGSVSENTSVAIDADTHAFTYAPNTLFKDIKIYNSRLDVDANDEDNSGDGSGLLHVQGRNIDIKGSKLYSDNAGPADGGRIEITASGRVAIADSRITADVLQGYTLDEQTNSPTLLPSTGSGGDIIITADQITVEATTKISTDTDSEGKGGDITLSANDISLQGSADRFGPGKTPSIRILAGTFSGGQSGNVFIEANEFSAEGAVALGTQSSTEFGVFAPPDGQYGDGGNVGFDVGSLTLRNGALITAATQTNGDGGSVMIKANDLSLYENLDLSAYGSVVAAGIDASTYGEGDGGDITIKATSLFSTGLSFVSSASTPRYYLASGAYGDSGQISVEVDSLHLEQGASLLTSTFYGGEAGDLFVRANDIRLLGQTGDVHRSGSFIPTRISTDSYGGRDGGRLTIEANTVEVLSTAGITAFTHAGFEDDIADGNGGDVSIDVGQITLRAGGQVGTSTFGGGDAGDLAIQATAGIDVSGLAIYEQMDESGNDYLVVESTAIASSAGAGATGNGGLLSLTTPSLHVGGGAEVTAETRGRGNAGGIEIEAGEILVSDVYIDAQGVPSGIVATVAPGGVGAGGPIDIVSDRIHLTNGGQITAATAGEGNAGNINVQASLIDIEGVSADGRSSSSISSQSATAFDAGSVTITGIAGDTQNRINISDYGAISVSNIAGGRAGNVEISAGRVELHNDGSIRAEANAGAEGNVTIESRDLLLLRDRSTITTNAMGTATGGNITLNAPTIVGLGNSDISANAVEGDGGNIQLITQGLIGLAFRDELTTANDITASSETGTDGTVQIESPDVDPNSGLVQLPENVADISNQVAASCATQNRNQFVSSGRGGLPNSPLHAVSNHAPLQDLGTFTTNENAVSAIDQPATDAGSASIRGRMKTPRPDDLATQVAAEVPLQEAGHWQLNSSGEVELLAARSVADVETTCLQPKLAAASFDTPGAL